MKLWKMVLRYMDNVKTDKYYFEKAINDIDAVEKYFDHKTYEVVSKDLLELKELFEQCLWSSYLNQ